MWPFLRPGQKILVKKSIGPDFKPGDLALYRASGQLLCHRLLRKEKQANNWIFYCRPDTSGGSDPVSENMVEGKVVAVLSGNKMVNLETPFARLRAITVLLLLAPITAALERIYKKIKGI